jgi:TM2 domain-containing membrane protein YozV
MADRTTKFCTECGAEINIKAEICPKCGVRQYFPACSNNDKITAGILALLVGGLGAHHFYLKHIGRGILYLLFCWTFIPAIISLVEGIIYLTMTDDEFCRKYGS